MAAEELGVILGKNTWQSWLAAIISSRLAPRPSIFHRRPLCSPGRVKIFQFTGHRS